MQDDKIVLGGREVAVIDSKIESIAFFEGPPISEERENDSHTSFALLVCHK